MARTVRPPLAQYIAKRDFRKTGEPKATDGGSVRKSAHLRFVVQKHDARRLHYDLRLELGDVMKSWAVTRGPSLDPAERRLAVEVEDHPLAYGDFEGTIPEGEYGGGTVMIWDRGFWEPTSKGPPATSLRDGELKFLLAGAKLNGSFTLVRLRRRPREKRRHWLLIKHKDSFATPGRDGVQRQDRSAASGRTMRQIERKLGDGATPFMTSGKATSRSGDRGRRATDRPARTSVEMPTLTHAERVLWPGRRPVTKASLAAYFLAVAPWMARHVVGRPCSFVRAPDGIGGQQFFQRHPMPGQPDSLVAVTVGETRDAYVQIDDPQTLVSMAQFSVLEFHPWNCAPHRPGVPGRLVFDLDPAPDVPFDTVVEAARELRSALEVLGLVAFCKTTGGKGLHIVTPLKADGRTTWHQAKLFARTVAQRLADQHASRYVTTMSKAKRRGRIFIDYLRNDESATAVAPLSPRARGGAPVSMPLTWSQVRKGLDPQRFTIHSAPRLITTSAAWSDYSRQAQHLGRAIDRLLGTT